MNKRKVIRYTKLAASLLTAAMIFSSCFMGGLNSTMVTPEIRAIGLPDPSIVASVTLKVTGPDMDPVEVSYSIVPSVINLAIPEGNDRTFELTVGTGPAYTGTIATFKGTATADINTDGAVVTLNMGVGSTKIVVPDYNNNRIVQIDDMSGAGWASATWSDLGFTSDTDFNPYDVALDRNGSIYIANNDSGGLYGGIYRYNSIEFTSGIPLPPSFYCDASEQNAPLTAVAIDHKNSRVYGIASNIVYYWDLIGLPGAYTEFKNPMIGPISALAVDIDGNVYIGGDDGNSQGWINKYDLNGNLGSSASSFLFNDGVSDITILNDEVYATINWGSSGARIEKFDLNTLDHTTAPFSYGTFSVNPTNAGEFLGPYNFLATMNDKLTMIDYYNPEVPFARLISFDDILGTGWTEYGSFGIAVGEFVFFGTPPAPVD
jgi:hypothetical protein